MIQNTGMLVVPVFMVLTFQSNSSYVKVPMFELKYLDTHISAEFYKNYSPLMY